MIIKVKVITKSKKIEIIKFDNKRYKIKLTNPREKGKANKQLIKILSKYFKIPQSSIIIKQGNRSSKKIIEIKNQLSK